MTGEEEGKLVWQWKQVSLLREQERDLALAENQRLRAALKDIAEGNVPPGFLNGVEGEEPGAFKERILVWVQAKARGAL
jgi:hypothetical protein